MNWAEAQRGAGVAAFGGRWRAVEEKVGEEVWIWKALNAKLGTVYLVLLAEVTRGQGQGATGIFEQHVRFL